MTPAQLASARGLRDALKAQSARLGALLDETQALYDDVSGPRHHSAAGKLYDAARWLRLSQTATEHARDILLGAEGEQ